MDKLLEVLKTGAWKAFALAVASGLLLIGLHLKIVPSPSATIVFGVYAVFLLSTSLAVIGALQSLTAFLNPGVWITHWFKRGQRRREAKAYLPYMTEDDRKIVGHLLHHNRKTFSGAIDGGLARELIARGIVNTAIRPGYSYDQLHIPFVVNDEAWAVLVEHKDQFPFIEDEDGGDPWRAHWMA